MSAALRSVSPLPSSIARAVVKKKKESIFTVKKNQQQQTHNQSGCTISARSDRSRGQELIYLWPECQLFALCLFCYVESTQAFVPLTASVAFVVSVCGRAAS